MLAEHERARERLAKAREKFELALSERERAFEQAWGAFAPEDQERAVNARKEYELAEAKRKLKSERESAGLSEARRALDAAASV